MQIDNNLSSNPLLSLICDYRIAHHRPNRVARLFINNIMFPKSLPHSRPPRIIIYLFDCIEITQQSEYTRDPSPAKSINGNSFHLLSHTTHTERPIDGRKNLDIILLATRIVESSSPVPPHKTNRLK